jgi:hypothetical protein
VRAAFRLGRENVFWRLFWGFEPREEVYVRHPSGPNPRGQLPFPAVEKNCMCATPPSPTPPVARLQSFRPNTTRVFLLCFLSKKTRVESERDRSFGTVFLEDSNRGTHRKMGWKNCLCATPINGEFCAWGLDFAVRWRRCAKALHRTPHQFEANSSAKKPNGGRLDRFRV